MKRDCGDPATRPEPQGRLVKEAIEAVDLIVDGDAQRLEDSGRRMDPDGAPGAGRFRGYGGELGKSDP